MTAMERFDAEIVKFWDETVKRSIHGMPWPQASAIVISGFSVWLQDKIIGDAELLEASPWIGQVTGYPLTNEPTWMVTCDDSNNPPALKAQGKIAARVMVLLFDKTWKWEFES